MNNMKYLKKLLKGFRVELLFREPGVCGLRVFTADDRPVFASVLRYPLVQWEVERFAAMTKNVIEIHGQKLDEEGLDWLDRPINSMRMSK